MLLTALHELAKSQRLLDDLPLQRRTLHALIPLNHEGQLRLSHLVVVSQPDERGKDRPGVERLLPRFPGENNGGKAYFLAEGTIPLLGRDKETGEPVFADSDKAPRKEKNSAKAFEHFWRQVKDAHDATGDSRLAALLAFKSKYLREHESRVEGDLPFLAVRPNKKGKLEFVGRVGLGDDDFLVLKSATLGFSVDGVPLTLEDEADPLRAYWFEMFRRLAFQGGDEADEASDTRQAVPAPTAGATLCLITGETALPVARSHKPKILGVPGLSSGGYIVSFAKEAKAFSSYGFEMGQNAPVSEMAAASYALALNELLTNEDTHLNLGPLSVCFWAKAVPQAARQFNLLMSKAHPDQVHDFLRGPFAGVEREVLKRDRLYTVALSGNAGRVVVQHWIDQTLDEAIRHFAQWWADLEIVPVVAITAQMKQKKAEAKQPTEPSAWPLAISNLARVSLRRSKEQKDDKLVSDRVVQLYRAALEGTSPPVTLLKPILDEFQSALIKNDDSDAKKRTYPFSSSGSP
jgi:CRISPR-associated protein Csd1